MNERMNEWVYEWMHAWMNEWMKNEWMSVWMNAWMNEWMSEWMNEYMIERITEVIVVKGITTVHFLFITLNIVHIPRVFIVLRDWSTDDHILSLPNDIGEYCMVSGISLVVLFIGYKRKVMLDWQYRLVIFLTQQW